MPDPMSMLPDLHKVRRLAIIRLSSIGDVTHALPLSAALGEAFPNLELTWIVEEMSADIVTGNPYLQEVLVIPRTRWKQGRWRSLQVWREYAAFLAGIRRRKFDVTLDLQGYAKSALLALASGAKHRYGWWRLRDGANLVSRSLPRREQSVHRVDWFLDVARAFGAEPGRVRFPLHVPAEAQERAITLLDAGGIAPETPFAVLNPAVGNETRRWGAARYAELAVGLAREFGLPSVLIGSGKDMALNEEVRTLAQQGDGWPAPVAMPLNLAGQTNLKELAAVLERCAVHVCGDTGSAHIAAALERPVVALYGPTDPAMAGPWGQSENVLARREFCTPECNVRKCMVDARVARCLSEITVRDVLEKVGKNLYGR
ncbi:MAG TPA: glycosyltransferase family 9 protein [Chthonomonadaceae bacterium]|nr:glycosyltransferase family 9 protein [Chthonomonadaceae bacterium]